MVLRSDRPCLELACKSMPANYFSSSSLLSCHHCPCLPITSHHHRCHHVITIIIVLFVVPLDYFSSSSSSSPSSSTLSLPSSIFLVIITCMDNILKYYFTLSELLPRIMSKPRLNSKPSQGQNVKLKTENLVLKSKFSGQSKTESNTTGGLSAPYSNPSNSPERQVRTELTK